MVAGGLERDSMTMVAGGWDSGSMTVVGAAARVHFAMTIELGGIIKVLIRMKVAIIKGIGHEGGGGTESTSISAVDILFRHCWRDIDCDDHRYVVGGGGGGELLLSMCLVFCVVLLGCSVGCVLTTGKMN